MLEPPATDVPVDAPFAASGSVSVTVVTGVPPPLAIGGQRPIFHVRSESLAKGQRFDSLVTQALSIARGKQVQLSFWVKPLRADLSVAGFKTRLELTASNGGTTPSDSVPVKLDLNDWTPIVIRCRVPVAGTARVAALFAADEDASPSLPLDYYFTEPQFVISDQPTIATQPRAATTAGDHLTVNLPALQSEWSVAVWATEAPLLVLSLLGSDGSEVLVQQTDIPSVVTLRGQLDARVLVLQLGLGHRADRRSCAAQRRRPHAGSRRDSRSRRASSTLYVARGMGPVETLDTGAAPDFTPTALPLRDVDLESAIRRHRASREGVGRRRARSPPAWRPNASRFRRRCRGLRRPAVGSARSSRCSSPR